MITRRHGAAPLVVSKLKWHLEKWISHLRHCGSTRAAHDGKARGRSSYKVGVSSEVGGPAPSSSPSLCPNAVDLDAPPQPSAFYKALFSSPFIAFFFSFLSFCLSVQMLLCWRPFCLRLYLSKDIMSLVYTTWKTNQPVLCMKYWLKLLCLLGGAQNKFGGIRGRPFQRSSVTTVCQQGRQWKKVRIFRQQWSCQVFMRSLQPAQGWLIAVRCGTTNCKSEWKMWC